MNTIFTRENRGRYTIFAVIGLLIVSLFGAIANASAASSDEARNGRLVTIHDRGEERVVLTHAQNVRDALADADISIVAEDTVEPGLDTQLVATNYTVNIYRARPVIVVDGAVRQKVMTSAQTIKGIAGAAGVELRDEDNTNLRASDDLFRDGASTLLVIDRATDFKLNLYGTEMTAYTNQDTVGEMLEAKDIILGEKDKVSPSEDTVITPGMSVSIWREGVQTRTVTEDIAFTTRYIHDVEQPLGYSKVKVAGVKGSKKVTYQITIKNGKEVKRKAIKTVVMKKPSEEVVIVGAKGGLAAALAKLRQCESGGNYANKNNPTYRGAYQFSRETWAKNGGYEDPADAPPSLQDAAAKGLYERRGWQPWPACSKALGLQDIYR